MWSTPNIHMMIYCIQTFIARSQSLNTQGGRKQQGFAQSHHPNPKFCQLWTLHVGATTSNGWWSPSGALHPNPSFAYQPYYITLKQSSQSHLQIYFIYGLHWIETLQNPQQQCSFQLSRSFLHELTCSIRKWSNPQEVSRCISMATHENTLYYNGGYCPKLEQSLGTL